MTIEHHPVFSRFERWHGPVAAGYTADFLGTRTQVKLFAADTAAASTAARTDAQPGLPTFDEEYFEWIDVLEAVDAADSRFTMVELGAGWGRWLAIGAMAARQRDLDIRLVGVEAEPSHFRWLKEHLRDNGIPEVKIALHEAAVAGADGTVAFHVGDPAAWYGQAIDPYTVPRSPSFTARVVQRLRRTSPTARGIVSVPALSLRTLLRDLERVDLIDLDVQGSEADVLEAASGDLDAVVRRVHVGTHSIDNEERCRALFSSLGWECRNDYPSQSESDTPYGRILFQDGVQTWRNRRL